MYIFSRYRYTCHTQPRHHLELYLAGTGNVSLQQVQVHLSHTTQTSPGAVPSREMLDGCRSSGHSHPPPPLDTHTRMYDIHVTSNKKKTQPKFPVYSITWVKRRMGYLHLYFHPFPRHSVCHNTCTERQPHVNFCLSRQVLGNTDRQW